MDRDIKWAIHPLGMQLLLITLVMSIWAYPITKGSTVLNQKGDKLKPTGKKDWFDIVINSDIRLNFLETDTINKTLNRC